MPGAFGTDFGSDFSRVPYVGDAAADLIIVGQAVGSHGDVEAVIGNGAAVIIVQGEASGTIEVEEPFVPERPKGPGLQPLPGWIAPPPVGFFDIVPVVGRARATLLIVGEAEGTHYTAALGRGKAGIVVAARATGNFFDAVADDNNFVLLSVAA